MSYISRPSHAALKQALDAWAWPGGYPVYAVMVDGEALCPRCARENIRLILADTRGKTRDGWHFAGATINWEDSDLYCDHCGNPIEAAYTPDTALVD